MCLLVVSIQLILTLKENNMKEYLSDTSLDDEARRLSNRLEKFILRDIDEEVARMRQSSWKVLLNKLK